MPFLCAGIHPVPNINTSTTLYHVGTYAVVKIPLDKPSRVDDRKKSMIKRKLLPSSQTATKECFLKYIEITSFLSIRKPSKSISYKNNFTCTHKANTQIKTFEVHWCARNHIALWKRKTIYLGVKVQMYLLSTKKARIQLYKDKICFCSSTLSHLSGAITCNVEFIYAY